MISDQLVLNLGCGTRTSPHVVNLDWSLYVRIASRPAARKVARLALRPGGPLDRRGRLERVSGSVVACDLRDGIPYESGVVDAVYLSHVLEHVDREQVPGFLGEIRRVLRPDGIVRIVVPDLARICDDYRRSYESARRGETEKELHDLSIVPILEQSVRRDAAATWYVNNRFRRRAENLVLGDARRRGETHQWMYDQVSLQHFLESSGFVGAKVVDASTSRIDGWSDIDLDRNGEAEHIAGSLYMEAANPEAVAPAPI